METNTGVCEDAPGRMGRVWSVEDQSCSVILSPGRGAVKSMGISRLGASSRIMKCARSET